jgi:hypothetical protein
LLHVFGWLLFYRLAKTGEFRISLREAVGDALRQCRSVTSSYVPDSKSLDHLNRGGLDSGRPKTF